MPLIPDAPERLRAHIEASIEAKRRLLEQGGAAILEAARLMTECLAAGHKLLLCGNGGSAADAQHIAAEFVGLLTKSFPRSGLAAIALTTDTSFLTASANDSGFAGIFERQVQALGREGDVLIGISTSGNSENVLRAVRYARQHGMRTIALTGLAGALRDTAEVAIQAPSSVTQVIQEVHITIGHVLCEIVERSLEPRK